MNNSKSHPVLYVEDNENDRRLFQVACEEAGLRLDLYIARDGEEAIAYLRGAESFSDRTRYPFPSLVLLDLKLPRKSGFEVLEWIRDRDTLMDVPVVILSASRQETDVKQAFEKGAIFYFVKPVSLPALVEMVKEIQEKWLS